MASNRTFTMIKPEAMAAGHAGKILDMILSRGFRLVSMKYTRLSEQEAGKFYEVHKERPFYGELVSYMASGPLLAAILEKAYSIRPKPCGLPGCMATWAKSHTPSSGITALTTS